MRRSRFHCSEQGHHYDDKSAGSNTGCDPDDEGDRAHEVLGKLCPVDLSAEGLQAGTIRRTRMAQVPAALWQSGPGRYSVICFRSQARYVYDLLSVAAQPGSEVNA